MPKFIPYDYNQNTTVVINYMDQLQPGTFEHAIHYLVDQRLDLTIFNPKFKNDDKGRPAYDPAILLKIILFAYSKGITSSREIQWCCETNILFKALSCDSVPHYTTIAHFVSSYSDEIETLFEQILLICHEQGLLGNELFAIDGCKMSSDSAKEWSGTFKELDEKQAKIKRQIHYHITAQKELDKNESLIDERKKRHEQAIETLKKAGEKVDLFLKTNSPRMGKGKTPKEVKSNITDNESAKMKTSKGTIQGFNGIASVDKKHQVIVDAQAFGEGQEQHTLKPILETISDRYMRLEINDDILASGTVITADTGFSNEANNQYLHENGIDAYVPDNQFRSRDPKFTDQKKKHGKRNQDVKKKRSSKLLSASKFDFDEQQLICRCPAGEILSYRGQRSDPQGKHRAYFEGKVSQCRHCDLITTCMRNPDSVNHRTGNCRQVSFIVSKQPQKQPREPNHTDWMKARVDSVKGKQIYGHRMSVVEPVFGNIGTNKGLNRFSLRGKTKVQGQWQLYCIVHNIEKLKNYGKMAA